MRSDSIRGKLKEGKCKSARAEKKDVVNTIIKLRKVVGEYKNRLPSLEERMKMQLLQDEQVLAPISIVGEAEPEFEPQHSEDKNYNSVNYSRVQSAAVMGVPGSKLDEIQLKSKTKALMSKDSIQNSKVKLALDN